MKKLIFLTILYLIGLKLQAQVGVNITGASPDASAILDVSSTTRGLLIPRMTTAEMNAISSPADGLMIFNTTDNCFYFRITSGWKKLINENNNHGVTDSDGDSYLSFRQPSTDDDTLRIFFDNEERYKISSRAIEVLNNQGSVFIGQGAGKLSTTAYSNVAVGSSALYHNTNHGELVAIGDSALHKNGIGASEMWHSRYNVAIGAKSLLSNTLGLANTAIGYQSLYTNTTASENTAIGMESLMYNSTGDQNTAVGRGALRNNQTGRQNSALGMGALQVNISGIFNTAIGYVALAGNTEGNHNTALGGWALPQNKTGHHNVAIGKSSLFFNDSGNSNVAIGTNALYFNNDRSNLVAIGDSAMYNNGVGATLSGHATGNTAIGSKSLYANTTGSYNCAIGLKSLYSNTTGYENSATGWNSLNKNTEGKFNTAYGSRTLFNNTTGNYNVAIGTVTMYSNISGSGNSALGHSALNSNETGFNNTAIGSEALYKNTTGNLNSAFGNRAGFEITTGTNNIVLGHHAGKNITTGSYNILVGDNVEATSETASYQMIIGDSLLLYGDISNKRIGIGTSNPKAILHANGTGTGGGNVLFSGQRKISGAGDPPASGAGTRMMWYPDQAAFRSGDVSGTQWDKANLGTYSLASGYNTKAQGTSAVAVGYNTSSTNDFTTAMGVYTTASGHSSTALGSYTSALSFAETVIGQFNTTYTPWDIYGWNALDRIFVVANGASDVSRSNALTVLKNGRVGIGVDNPLEQLHTTGTIRFSGLVAGSGTQAVMVDAIGNLSKRTLNAVAFNGYSETDPTWTGNPNVTDKISRTGNVGIGASATNPTYILSVGYNGVGLDSPDENTLTFNTSGTERMCVNNGNVGIGCFNPGYKLSIGSNTTGIHNPTTNALSIITNNLERIRIGDNGNVSIGSTSTANNRLRVISSVSGGTYATGYFENEHASGLALRASSNSDDGTILSIQQGSGYSLRCDGYDPSWFVAMIVKGRQVGINTSDPTQNLDVNGNARIRSIGSGAYSGPVNRMSDGTLTTSTSDVRLKENIETIHNGLEKVKQLRGVTFTWKSNPEYGTKYGFIAQELEKVIPELVFTNDSDGYKGVNYAEMTSVLVEAVKEQQTEIDELKKIVQQQQTQISALLELNSTKTASK